MNTLESIIEKYDPISLEEMDEVKLLNRTDTKYVFSTSDLPSIFEEVLPYYRMLEIEGKKGYDYRTLYYDTPEFGLYNKHQNGKLNRFKVRFREYIGSGLCFLEIKFKNNKGRTVKSRIKVKSIENELTQQSQDFINSVMKEHSVPLESKLMNYFTRYTLVSRRDKERLTIDLGLRFEDNNSNQKQLGKVVIAEVKQENASRNSYFVQAVKSKGIRQTGMSKYCMGALLLNPGLKKNNFKPKYLLIKKLNDGVLA